MNGHNSANPNNKNNKIFNSLVKQDPRSKVRTTSAKTETTNTTTDNATIFNSNKNTITFQSTRQTITNHQTACVTEITTRRTPNPEELEEMMRILHLSKKFNTESNSSSNAQGIYSEPKWRRKRPNDLPGVVRQQERMGSGQNKISPKSATKFKKSTSPVSRLIFTYETADLGEDSGTVNESPKTPKTPTLVRIQETSVSQKNGSTFTQRVEKRRIKFKLPSPLSRTAPTSTNMEDKYKSNQNDKSLLSLVSEPQTKLTTTVTTEATTTTAPTPPNSYTSPYSLRTVTLVNNKKPISTTTTTATATPTKRNLSTTTSTLQESLNFKPSTTIAPLCVASTTTRKTAPVAVASGKTIIGPILKPGYAYIFNNFIFDHPDNEERYGSAEDVKALKDTFEYFKLKVNIIENAKLDKIRKTVEKVQNKNFADYACLVIVILSHGSRHEEIAARDGRYSIDDDILFPILRNPSLNDKPKLFFIQACKGSMENNGMYKDAVLFQGPSTASANEILKCYSTFEGFVSYRSEKGSMFIQALCQNLKLFGCTKNIKDIMELVTQIVKQQSQSKQIPAYTSTLTKPFIFGDYVKWCK